MLISVGYPLLQVMIRENGPIHDTNSTYQLSHVLSPLPRLALLVVKVEVGNPVRDVSVLSLVSLQKLGNFFYDTRE